MVESPGACERGAERILSRVAERRMTEVMGEAERFGEVLVEAERPSHGPPDLRDLEAVGQPHPIVVPVRRDEHLRLVTQAAECDGVDQSVAVALENVSGAARAAAILAMEPSAGSSRVGGDERRKLHSPASGAILSAWELVKFSASIPTEPKSSARIFASDRPRKGPTSNRAPPALREI